MSLVFSVFAVLIPTCLAGLRAETVGTDTEHYAVLFNNAKFYDQFIDYYNDYNVFEIGALALNYIVSRVSNNYTIYLLIVHLIIISLIYTSAFKLRKYLNPAWVMFIFYFMSYNESLNISRQYIAIAFSLLAFIYLVYEKSYFKYILCLSAGVSFHYSSLVCLLYPILLIMIKDKPLQQYYLKILIAFIFLAFLMIVPQITYIPFISDLFNDKYAGYVSSEKSGSVSLSILIIYILISILLFKISSRQSYYLYNIFFIISLEAVMFCLSGKINIYLYRLGLYPFIISTISIPIFFKRSNYSLFYKIFFFFAVVFFWYYTVVYRGSNATIPYSCIAL